MDKELDQLDIPMVSVLMTAYNREDFIAEAIESVLASTFTNFELIIVDDGSIDNTVSIAKKFAGQDSRIKVYVNPQNLGQFQNRNIAAGYAKGKYLKYLDSDDKILDFGLAYCVDAMEKFPEAGLGTYNMQETNNPDFSYWSSEKIVREHFFVKQQLSVGPTGTIINRIKFEEIGRFDTRFGVPSDMFFNIKMAARFPVVLLPKLFVYYRRHEGQEINNRMDYLKFGHLYFKELLINVPLPLQKKEIKFLYRKMNKRHAVNLTKYFLKTKSIKKVSTVMKETYFSLFDLITSFFK